MSKKSNPGPTYCSIEMLRRALAKSTGQLDRDFLAGAIEAIERHAAETDRPVAGVGIKLSETMAQRVRMLAADNGREVADAVRASARRAGIANMVPRRNYVQELRDRQSSEVDSIKETVV